MLVMHIEVTRAGTGTLNQRKWRGIKKRLWRGMADYWIDEIRPKHFRMEAVSEYNYTPRHPRYEGRKRRRFGIALPLRWTGKLQFESKYSRIQASHTGSTVRVRGRVLNLYRGKSKSRIDMAREISAVSPADVRLLVNHAQQHVNREMKELDLKKDRVVIKVG